MIGKKADSGFTIVELMVTMVAFVFVIAAASQMFTGLLTQFKQQGKIAETNIEGIVGLNILRQDIEHAGLGLPWNVTGIADSNGDDSIDFSDDIDGYTETAEPAYSPYNDANQPDKTPRAFISDDNAGFGDSDYLVIKSASAATDLAAGKNTRLTSDGSVRTWGVYTDDLNYPPDTDNRVIVLSPGATNANSRSLVVTGGSYYTRYSAVSDYAPEDNTDVRLVYGISADNLRAPFNRADYYISTVNPDLPPPVRCAPGTGVLVKAMLNHSTGEFTELPVLDCVADMQVIYDRDTDDDGDTDSPTNDVSAMSADDIREQVKQVQVYILAHEGQRDPNFTFTNCIDGTCSTPEVRVGRSAALGRDFDLSAITDYEDYRWKVYTISVQTENLR